MKNYNPLVSIIIPVYNGVDFLREAIDNALTQSYNNIEILVINDGSNDKNKTEKIALSYGKKIKYYYKQKKGIASALNYGIKKMNGEYFSWLNRDSLYHVDKIYDQIEFLKNIKKNTIIFSDYDFINENSTIIKYRKITNYSSSKFIYYLIFKNIIKNSSLLIPREYFNDIGLFNEKLKVIYDYEMWFRLSRKYEFVHIPKSLVHIRVVENRSVKKESYNTIKEENEVYNYILNDITSHDIVKNMNNKKNIGLFYIMYSFYLLMKSSYLEKAAYSAYKLSNKNIFNNTFPGFLKQIKYFLKYWSFKLNFRKFTKFIQNLIVMFKVFIFNIKIIFLKRGKKYLLLVFPLYIFNKNKYYSLEKVNSYLRHLKTIYPILMFNDFIAGNNKVSSKKTILIAFEEISSNKKDDNINYEKIELFDSKSIDNSIINDFNIDLFKLKIINQIKVNYINYYDLDVEIINNFYIKDIFDIHFEEKLKKYIDYFPNKYLHKYIYPLINRVNTNNKCINKDFSSVLHINTMDILGGAAKFTYRLHLKLIKNNINSKLLVANKFSIDNNVDIIRIDNSNLQKRLDLIASESGYMDCFHLSTFNIKNTNVFKNADVIHLHNLHGNYFNLFALPEITRLKPCIWTLHDMFSITGHCAHSFNCNKWIIGCKECPDLNIPLSIPYDRTKELWEIKKNVYSQSKLTVVCPSNWLKAKIEKSLLKNQDIKLIYHGIDEKIYKPILKRDARRKLNIPQNKIVLLFNSHGGKENYWKGGEYLDKVFEYFKNNKNIIFIIIGGNNSYSNNKEINTGYIDDEKMLNLYYSASDLFVYPSIAESFGLVIAESLSSGTPVITFKTCSIPEIVTHMEDGYLADYKNVDDFINGIKIFIKDKNLRRKASDNGRKKILKNFTIEKMTGEYIKLYNEVCKQV